MIALFAALVIYMLIGAGVCSAAFVLGGVVERRVARGFLIAAALTIVASVTGDSHWHGANWRVIAVDVGFSIWLVALACHSERFWPLWAASSQTAGTIAHLPAILLPMFPKELYAATQPFWAFPLLLSLFIGSLNNWRRLRLR